MAGISKGAAGEVVAARFLREKGYTLIAGNYRTRLGEIDIIARDGDYIVFVEVKTRGEQALYAPREAVTLQKQQKIIRSAALYMERFPTSLQPRFDVIEVVMHKTEPLTPLELNHIQGAYETGDLRAAF